MTSINLCKIQFVFGKYRIYACPFVWIFVSKSEWNYLVFKVWIGAYLNIGCISFAYFIGKCQIVQSCIDVKWCLFAIISFAFLHESCTLSWIACESFSVNDVFFVLPAQDEEDAHEPGVRSHFICDLGEHLLLAAGAGDHAGRASELRLIIHKLVPVSGRRVNCKSEGGKHSESKQEVKLRCHWSPATHSPVVVWVFTLLSGLAEAADVGSNGVCTLYTLTLSPCSSTTDNEIKTSCGALRGPWDMSPIRTKVDKENGPVGASDDIKRIKSFPTICTFSSAVQETHSENKVHCLLNL